MLRDYKRVSDNKFKNANHLFFDYSKDLKTTSYLESSFEAHFETVTNNN